MDLRTIAGRSALRRKAIIATTISKASSPSRSKMVAAPTKGKYRSSRESSARLRIREQIVELGDLAADRVGQLVVPIAARNAPIELSIRRISALSRVPSKGSIGSKPSR